MLLKMKLSLCFTWLKHERRSIFLHFLGPSGLSILPDLLCWWALDVHAYDGAPTAANLRQTQQTVDLGNAPTFDSEKVVC